MAGQAQYVFRRIAQALLTIFIASTLTFFILRLLPGDPTTLFADAMMTPEIRQKLLADFGLDQPIPVQYGKYLYQLVQGNLGMSISQRAPVSSVISDALPWTLLLAGSSLVLTLIISVLLGLVTVFRRGKPIDLIIRATTVTLGALFIPWVALMVMYIFGRQLNWLPIGGATDPQAGDGWARIVDIIKHLILPCLVLTLTNLGPLVLFLRTSMVEVMQEDFIRTSRAKGVIERKVILVHALRNALIPFVTVVGLRLGFLVSGAVLTETVFAYPGIGRLIFRSVQQHDYPVLQGAFLMLAITVVVFNLATDLVYGLLDPRINTGGN
ncbi:MAG: ABC transporter permease [Thermomicrobiales bacterium]|nr:ABC transporter permease [Thermomicrobiales bacterium]